MAQYKVGIIGCGLIGNKRAEALEKFDHSKLVMCADVKEELAKELASKYDATATTDWKEVITNDDIDIVLIATINQCLTEMTIAAIKAGKHVLVEKPAGRTPQEVQHIVDVYEELGKKVKIKVGFNHRFHPAFGKAKEIIANEGIGDIMMIRARYGHGARVGYDKEWRAYKETAGGGEMLDQGSHLIDLCRDFMGDFSTAIGFNETLFWDQEVEDNTFALLKTKKGQVAQLHASCTQWKNIFSMEIFCKTGQINIDGLVRSYGAQKLTFYKMKPEMGIPDKFEFSWENVDLSWEKEYDYFVDCIENDKEVEGGVYDALASIKLVYNIYEWSEKFNPNKEEEE